VPFLPALGLEAAEQRQLANINLIRFLVEKSKKLPDLYSCSCCKRRAASSPGAASANHRRRATGALAQEEPGRGAGGARKRAQQGRDEVH